MNKMVIVMRKDLNMRKGKMIAQGAHACLKVFIDRSFFYHCQEYDKSKFECPLTKEMTLWLNEDYKKICVSVNSLEELLAIKHNADEMEIPCSLVQDNGLTEFKGEKTYTCLALGPDDAQKIDKITGHLKLL